jgi:uncharacterized protein YggT (Ycf19 family)
MLDTSFHFFLSSLAIIPPSDTPRVDFGTKAAVYAVHCDSSALAETLSQMLWCVRLAWAFYFAIFISRFFFQIFGHVQIFGNPFIEFIFRTSRLPNRLFIGILPSIYGIDIGIFLTFHIFERIDQFLNSIAIYGA